MNESASIWNLAGQQATLSLPTLVAHLDAAHPEQGLGQLKFFDHSLGRRVLGVATSAGGDELGDKTELDELELIEAFVRENDLVAAYAARADEEFRWQVDWRVSCPTTDVVVLDLIVSLQTRLLESYPQVVVCSQLDADQAGFVCDGNLVDAPLAVHDLSIALFRWKDKCSYAEMTHPDDQGNCVVHTSDDGVISLERRLGGAFLEKGVIRRMRVRGVFLPPADDAIFAQRYLAKLVAASPPLTA
jgi:hypothetical protein